jgi:ankyrin repeat protein
MKNIATLTRGNGNASSGYRGSRESGAHSAARRGLTRLARLAITGGMAFAVLGALPAQATPADTMIKAVKFDDVKEVNKQLAQGMDPNMTDNQGMPLLVIAAREKSDKVIAALIANSKTDIEITDKVGENAMMMAALNDDITIVKS